MNFKLNLKAGDYKVYIETIDLISKYKYVKKIDHTVKNSDSELLISDVVYHEKASNQRIISGINNFNHRNGYIQISFNTFQKNRDIEYYHNINLTEKKLVSEEILDMAKKYTIGIFKTIYEGLKNTVTEVDLDTLMEYSLYQTTLESEKKENLKHWSFTISKTLFDKIKFRSSK